MRAKGGHYSPKVKSDAALDACRETKTLSELSAEYGASSMQISRWKKVLVDRAVELFETSKPVDIEKITDPLYKEIGRLKMDLEWLKKKRGGVELGREAKVY